MCRVYKNGNCIADDACGSADIVDLEFTLANAISQNRRHKIGHRLGVIADQVGTFLDHATIELIDFEVVGEALEFAVMKGNYET